MLRRARRCYQMALRGVKPGFWFLLRVNRRITCGVRGTPSLRHGACPIRRVALRGVKPGFWFLLRVNRRITCGVRGTPSLRHGACPIRRADNRRQPRLRPARAERWRPRVVQRLERRRPDFPHRPAARNALRISSCVTRLAPSPGSRSPKQVRPCRPHSGLIISIGRTAQQN